MSSENTSEFQPSRKLLLANSFPYKLVPDDSMTILMAFRAPTVEIIGLTTIFGNTTTKNATQNALLLVRFEMVEYPLLCFLLLASC
jgi:hypothetical protein